MREALFDLSDKVVVVTGATYGMGAACADLLVACGAKVVVTSRDSAKLALKVAELNSLGSGGAPVAVGLAGDIADKNHLQRLVDLAYDRYSRITTLLCSPTIKPWLGPAIETPDEIFDEQFTYTVKCRFWLSAMVIPHMIGAGNGSLIFIGSGSIFESTSERCVNTMARAAEWQMMKNLAAEYGKHNVRSNIIAPGSIRTPSSQKLFEHPAGLERIGKLPMRRIGEVNEVASVAAFLASDASSYTTGGVIPVDGGRLLHAVDGMLTAAERKSDHD